MEVTEGHCGRPILVRLHTLFGLFRESMLQRYILIWLLVSSGAAFLWPEIHTGFDPFVRLGSPAINVLIVVIMFAVGCLLSVDEVNQLARRWPTVLMGTGVQYLSMPFLAWTVVQLFRPSPELATGIMIVGCVPGAMASNVLTLTARGNVSYSVSLTTAATLLSPIVVPLALKLTLGRDVKYEATDAMKMMLLQIVMPVLAGHALSRTWERFRDVVKPVAPTVANLAILAVIAIAVALKRDDVRAASLMIVVPLMIVNLLGYLAGYWSGGLFQLPQPMRRALTLEVGMQNAGAGTALAIQLFGKQSAAIIPCVVYTFGCMLTGTLLAMIWNRLPPKEHDRMTTGKLVLMVLIGFVGTALPTATAQNAESVRLPKTEYAETVSPLDGEKQSLLYWAPEVATRQPTPLFVFLHSWSSDYKQDNSKWMAEAVRRNWIWLHADFRGINQTPKACGSRYARQDVLDAMQLICRSYQVDPERIYLGGVSGGGHMAMLMAGHHPDRFSAVSAWVGISDLAEWHRFHLKDGVPRKYARMVQSSLSGVPGESAEIDAEYRDRSPLFHLHRTGDLPISIYAGVEDGHAGSVPISHSLKAFNVIAASRQDQLVSDDEMQQLWEVKRLRQPTPSDTVAEPDFGRAVLLRRSSGPANVTIFEGGHESLAPAACEWLSRVKRRVPIDCVLP